MKLGHFLRLLRASDLHHVAACGECRQLKHFSGVTVTLCGSSRDQVAARAGAALRRRLMVERSR